MAGDWIKVEHSTPDKPEVFRIAETLSITPEHALGCLVRVWMWADQQSYSGSIAISPAVVDRIARIDGFGKAMVHVNWLTEAGIPNFDRHNGQTAKARASTQKRVSKHRSCNVSVTPEKRQRVTFPRPFRKLVMERDGFRCLYCGRTQGEYSPPETSDDAILSLDHVIPKSRGGDETLCNIVTCCMCCNIHKGDRTPDESGLPWPLDENGKRYGSVTESLPREEKRRVSDPPLPPKGKKRFDESRLSELRWPQSLDNEAGRAALTEWLRHKTDKGSPYKSTAGPQKILDHFGRWTPVEFQAAVDASIQNNYQGLFPAKENGKSRQREFPAAQSVPDMPDPAKGERYIP